MNNRTNSQLGKLDVVRNNVAIYDLYVLDPLHGTAPCEYPCVEAVAEAELACEAKADVCDHGEGLPWKRLDVSHSTYFAVDSEVS